MEVVIRTFPELDNGRPLQEYCKPFQQESLTVDFDDICDLAVSVARRLLGVKIDYFQLRMTEAISEVMTPLEEP